MLEHIANAIERVAFLCSPTDDEFCVLMKPWRIHFSRKKCIAAHYPNFGWHCFHVRERIPFLL